MDEQKKTLGRSRVYTGNPDGSKPGEISEEGRRSRHAQPIGARPKEHLSEPSGRRRRDEETDAKMRLLWGVLFVLIVILVAAIIYEVVLGYGSLETGSERMGTNTLETELSSLTGEDDTVQENQTEADSEAETSAVTGLSTLDSQNGSDEQETEENTDPDASGSQEANDEQETVSSQDDQAAEVAEGALLSMDTTLAGVAE